MRHVRKRSNKINANENISSEDVVAMDSVLAEAKEIFVDFGIPAPVAVAA